MIALKLNTNSQLARKCSSVKLTRLKLLVYLLLVGVAASKFEESNDSESEEEPDVPISQNYDSDTELPMFSTTPFGYPAEKVARFLLVSRLLTLEKAQESLHVQPPCAMRKATCIVDINDVELTDLKVGTWKIKWHKNHPLLDHMKSICQAEGAKVIILCHKETIICPRHLLSVSLCHHASTSEVTDYVYRII